MSLFLSVERCSLSHPTSSPSLSLLTNRAETRASQTFSSIREHWPRSPETGLVVHWTSPSVSGEAWPDTEGGWSSVDTAELVAGVLFAGKYFGGSLETEAQAYASAISWECCIASEDSPTLYALFDPKNKSGKAVPGVCGGDLIFSGELKPFNEYFLVADLAQKLRPGAVAPSYFQRWWSDRSNSSAAGGNASFPKANPYCFVEDDWVGGEREGEGESCVWLLSDSSRFVSSFIPQFLWFLSSSFHDGGPNEALARRWGKADRGYWKEALKGIGSPLAGKVWGSGAGPTPDGYFATKIGNSPSMTYSPPIMAGFLATEADPEERIESELALVNLWDNHDNRYRVRAPCTYSSDKDTAFCDVDFLWRLSASNESWRAPSYDSVDYSTAVLGLASINGLDATFFKRFAF